MRRNIVLTLLLATIQCSDVSKNPETSTISSSSTLRIQERVRLLKKQLVSSLRHRPRPDSDPIPAYDESDENAPIAPILRNDKLKKDDRYKLKKLITTPKPMIRQQSKTLRNLTPRQKVVPRIGNVPLTKIAPRREPTTSRARDIFYRKSYDPKTPVEWLHCSELITPYIKGVKKVLTKPIELRVKDHIVKRLLLLLASNTTRLSRSEKKSIMYQISKLNIRLFSWETSAMTALMHVIMKSAGTYSERPTFVGIKEGIKALLASWATDLSDPTTLLLQARVFRPPCVRHHPAGSSKFVRGSTIPVRTASPKDADDQECFRGVDKCR